MAGPLAVAGTLAGLSAAAGQVTAGEADPAGSASARVAYRLDVEGELFAAADRDTAPLTRPISVAARFDFDEHPASADGPAALARRYRTAAATITVAGEQSRRRLGTDAAAVLVSLAGTTPVPYLADGFLSRGEAELLDIPFDPALFDRLRPAGEATAGTTWTIDPDAVAGLLAIDTVESGPLAASLERVEDGIAVVSLKGTVTGAADGVETRIAVAGAFRVRVAAGETDGSWRLTGDITRLEVELGERRQAGWVAPGLDVDATIEVSRSVAASDLPAAATELGPVAGERPSGPGRPGYVWHRHPQGRYSMAVDSRWRVVEDGPEGLVMRLVDRGMLVAQCSVLPLPRGDADSPPTRETVCRDVERSLGRQFARVAEAESHVRSDGTRVVRVVADGTADERPFRWIHHVLTDPQGYRAAVTCMIEPAAVERFAAADRELVAGLVLLPDPPRTAAMPAGEPR